MMMLSGREKQLWKRVAIAVIVVGAIVTVGRWLPLYGLDYEAVRETINICSGRSLGNIIWPMPMYVCHPAGPAFNELGQSALLGTVGLLAFLMIWCRRWWTNKNNDDLRSN